ncbi:hypothetical protein JX265_004154 [Neoarthrinium moseri]|uniref:Uncharacterized protein n=1 Tax=Neoarthrinium moseri TaxID=1658444 RepID=A0A9P9WRV8_9PEZI|nr:uncharacterized protein JN550_008658 [Neoarthrinium moseri]KAI1864838.1 hypothetical protein JN550_008658 [Neoarthrinium moseri]KAI1876628.1 hypothetical protein JX265_004154 [Neoarthrinium moseri]
MAEEKTMAKNNKGRVKTNNSGASVLALADDQERSRLFQLPQELRDSIYDHLFLDTRVSHGRRPLGEVKCLRITPAPNSLSLLKTCRRARAEIGHSWLSQVLFNFEDVKTMMEKLTAVPLRTLSAIRHLCVRGHSLTLSCPEKKMYYNLVHGLKFLPGLQLDTLTVLNLYGNCVTYDVLNSLIKYGQGWRELRYISRRSDILQYVNDFIILQGFDDYNQRRQRKPQPANWIRTMNSRDGAANQPSVAIYRSTLPGTTCTVINEATRVRFEQECPEPSQEALFGGRACASCMSSGENAKELMVIVRRGNGVDYQEKQRPPLLPEIGDIRADCPGMTWEEISKKHFAPPSDSGNADRCFGNDSSDHAPEKMDEYRHVEEYEWTPLKSEY